MASSRRTYCRRQQESLQRHQLRLEGLEKRYALNAAPVLDPSASPQLNSVIEDASIPVGQVGTLVSDLIDTGGTHNNFSDADGDSPGIAITGTNLGDGTLWYSINGGTDWSQIADASDSQPLRLAANDATRLFFQPPTNFSGVASDVFTFKAWDQDVSEPSIYQPFGNEIDQGFNGQITRDGNVFLVGSRTYGWDESSTSFIEVGGSINDASDFVLSDDGLRMVVGFVDDGHIKLYHRTTVHDDWQSVGRDIPLYSNGIFQPNKFSLSGDGNVLLVKNEDYGMFEPTVYRWSESLNDWGTGQQFGFFGNQYNGGQPGHSMYLNYPRVQISHDGNIVSWCGSSTLWVFGYSADLSAYRSARFTVPSTPAGANTGSQIYDCVMSSEGDAVAIHFVRPGNINDVHFTRVFGFNKEIFQEEGFLYYLNAWQIGGDIVGFHEWQRISLSDNGKVLASTGTNLDESNTTIYSWDIESSDWLPVGDVITLGSGGLSPSDYYRYSAISGNGNALVINDGDKSYVYRLGPTHSELSTAMDTVSVRVTSVNNAPVLDPAASPQLRVVNEDAGVPVGPVGTLVLELIDASGTQNNFSDIDGDLPGIALTDTNLKGGTLWYTTDGGELWNNVGEVSDSAALLLYADSNTRLFFTPAVDFSGTINDVLEFRAWDRSGGHANGAKNIQTLSGDLAVVGSYAGNWGATTFSHDGNTLYFADQSRGLQAINVSRPEHPVLIGSSGTTGWSFHDLTLSPDGNTVYAANSANGLQVIDVSNPASPTIVGVVSTPHTATSVTLSPNGETAYVSNYYGGGIQVVDVSDPFNPSILGTIVTPHSAIESAISTDGNTLYVADYMSGLQIIDVRDPTSLSIVGSFSSEPAFNTRYTDVTVSMDGNLLYIADNNNGLFIINVSNPTAPSLVGSISDIPNIDRFSAQRITLAADGNSVFVTTANDDRPFSTGVDSFGEVQIIDVSDPMNPLWVSSLDTVSASSYSGPRSMELSNVGTTACVVQGPSLLLMDLGASAEFSVHTNLALVEVLPINNAPTLNQISDLVIPEDSLAQLVRLTGITAGGGETQPVKVTGTSSNPFLVLQPSVSSLEELDGLNRLLTVAPLPNQYGMATITVTVEDGGLDLDLDTTEDNATFSQTFDVTVTPDTDDPPSLVTPHGKMFIHETLSGDPLVSYHLPAVNVNGEAINGLLNRITVTSSDTALIPDPTVLYASADVPSSLSFTPVANANGTATLSIQVEDGGPDNDFATTEDNRQATHQVEVNVLEVISNQGSAILAKDSSENLYVNTQPVVYHDQQQAQSTIAGFAAIGASSDDGENALLVERDSVTNRLVTDDAWRINGLFESLQNESSPVLDLSGREVSVPLNIVAVAGAYEINGVNNPTLTVRRGQTYTFNLNTAGHPFYLQTTGGGYQSASAYNGGFSENGQTSGEHQWVVPEDAPDEIFYQCEFHPVMFGKIVVVD